MTSMTGFARVTGHFDGPLACTWTWEARSVNGRGLDLRVRLPQGFDSLDAPARAAAGRKLARGNVTLVLTVESAAASAAPRVNGAVLETYARAAEDLAARFPGLAPARIDGLMSLRGVLEASESGLSGPQAETALVARDTALLAGLEQALSDLVAARQAEGERLTPTLTAILARIDDLRGRAAALGTVQPPAIRERLRAQVQVLLESASALSEERLYQEAAILATKGDVREELDRLAAHVRAAHDLLAEDAPVGRRLDFLCQEFNREANTLCSKAADTEMTTLGLDLKAAIEQIREQIQNIE